MKNFRGGYQPEAGPKPTLPTTGSGVMRPDQVALADALARLASIVERMAGTRPGQSHGVTMSEFAALRRSIDDIRRKL